MPDIVHIPLTVLDAGQVTETITLDFQEGIEELIVLDFTNQRSGQARLVVTRADGGLLETALQDGSGTKRVNVQPLPSSISFFVECFSGQAQVSVTELRTAIAVLPPGSSGSSIPEIDQIDEFVGRASGETDPVYTSTKVVVQNSDLETAVSALDADTGGASSEDADQDSFAGRGAAETQPTYSSSEVVGANDDLETAIGKLDAEVGNGRDSLHRDSYVLVRSTSDLPAPVAGVITLVPGTVYEINGTIDLGTDRLVVTGVPHIRGVGRAVDKIITSNAGALLTSTSALEIDNLTLTNSSGAIFDLNATSTEGFISQALILSGSASIGTVQDYGFMTFRNMQVVACSDGLTVDGTNGFLVITDSLSRANLGTFTFLTLPSGAAFTAVGIDSVAIDSGGGQTALSIDAAVTVTELGLVTGCAFTGVGTVLSGITKGDVDWQFRSNTGILDSRIIGEMVISGNSSETTITVIGQFEDINATFADGILEKFTRAGDTLTYVGKADTEALVQAILKISGPGATDRIASARFLVNGSPVGVQPATAQEVDSTRPQPLNLIHAFTVSNGDTISIQVANTLDTQNLIVEDMLLTCAER